MWKRWGWMMGFVLWMSGCVHSPQQLEPSPELQADKVQPVGQGQAVVVTVLDQRSSEVLGTRGGVYPETSEVRVSTEKVLPQLQAKVEQAVRLLGFTPVPQGSGMPSLKVVLTELLYQSPKDDVYVTDAQIEAVLEVVAHNQRRNYEGRYRSTLNQSFGMAPDSATNAQLVSDVLSGALNRAFKDPMVGQILLGP